MKQSKYHLNIKECQYTIFTKKSTVKAAEPSGYSLSPSLRAYNIMIAASRLS